MGDFSTLIHDIFNYNGYSTWGKCGTGWGCIYLLAILGTIGVLYLYGFRRSKACAYAATGLVVVVLCVLIVLIFAVAEPIGSTWIPQLNQAAGCP